MKSKTVQQVFREKEKEDDYKKKQSWKTSGLRKRVIELKAGPHFVLPHRGAAEGKL